MAAGSLHTLAVLEVTLRNVCIHAALKDLTGKITETAVKPSDREDVEEEDQWPAYSRDSGVNDSVLIDEEFLLFEGDVAAAFGLG